MSKKKSATPQINVNDELSEKLATFKLSDTLKLMDDFQDMNVKCTSTGFPALDKILHPTLLGLPAARHIEIFSRRPSAGKTTLAMQILKNFQDLGLRVGLADVEKTVTTNMVNDLGIITDPNQDPTKYALRIMRSEIFEDSEDNVLLSCEDILNMVKKASMFMDLIVVDSIDAMVAKSEQEKGAEDNKRVGNISKLLSEFFRSNTSKLATIIWINQMRQKVGGYSPTGGEVWVTPGGNAVPFYSSIRLELTVIERLKKDKDKDSEPYGFLTEVNVQKNKIAPQWRKCNLTYLFGEGFSVLYDYYAMAIKAGIIEKAGAWLQYKDMKIQGGQNFFNELKKRPDVVSEIKALIDGESVTETETKGEINE